MDTALASLDRGVRGLFTEPSPALFASSLHPMCECMLQQAPPPDWRHLPRFPVLKRHVLAEFRSVALEMAKTPQTPRKRKKRSIAQQSGDVQEYKALCLASLCQKLAQCKLLAVGEAELMETVVKLESLDVLRRVVVGKLLPLGLRMLLLAFTLREQVTKCLESKVQSWIQQVCEKILEDVLEATATGGSSEPPKKRARTRSDDKKVEGPEEMEKSCEFCRGGASAESLRSKYGGWEFLVECSQQTARVLEKSGESYSSNQAMVALSAFWDSLPVAGLTSGKTGKRRKRSQISVKSEEGVEPSMSIAAYERICQVNGTTDVFRKMWTNVWEREFKSVVKSRQITLADAIHHCSKADTFASIVLPGMKVGVTYLPGFRIVVEMIRSLFVDISGIITAFAQAVGAGSGALTQITIPSSVGASSTKRILRSYLSELLKSPKIRHEVGSSSPLELLFVLYKIFSEPFHGDLLDGGYSKHWDALMSQFDSDASVKDSPQEGINWCLFLDKCVLDVDAKEPVVMHGRDNFLQAFKSYCRVIMHGVIATGGRSISSDGASQRQLINVESDRAAVCQTLAQMMTTFGEDWVSSLISQLLKSSASFRSTDEICQRGMRNLLFPALVSGMKSTSKSNPKRRKTGQQLFTGIVRAVNSILKESEPTSLYLVSLMRFCEAWDAYQRTHTKEPPARANRWGFRAMVELDTLPKLLECYEKVEVLHQETSEALEYAAEVLQNAPNCPPTLEGSLYKVLSVVKAGVEQVKTAFSVATDAQLVSHSGDVLQRLLRAVKFADLAQIRELMGNIKDSIGTLNELRQQLERWFSFVETYGASFAGKESRMELSLLCTRLIRWFPDEFGSMRFLLMTPLDSHFVYALKAFVKEAGRPNNVERPSFLSSTARSALPSAVRVEMALHLYLSAAAFPDLETLTVLLIKAMIKCRSPDAFNHLAKIAQKNGRALLPESAVATLSSPLKGLEFSGSALIRHDEEVDDKQLKTHARHAKALIYQENTLKLLADSVAIFEGGISWSVVLFDDESATTWLPHFFEYILKTEFCEGTLRADLLLTNLETLLTRRADGKMLREAYWLTALLNTTLVACSSRSAGAYTDLDGGVHDRLRLIAGNLLQLLAIGSNTRKFCSDSDSTAQLDGEEVLGLLNLSKCARLSMEENGASWTRERRIETRTSEALRMNVSEIWNTEVEGSQAVAEPPIQLFMPFVHWLSGALIYSQSFLEEPSAAMRRWERTFTSYVTDLYLHLEFENVTCNLLKAWLTTWITSNIARGQDELQLIALLPSQVALFRRLGLTPYRGSSPIQISTSIWQLIFVAINLALAHTDENPTGLEQATELVVSTLSTLELVELSASSDFVRFSNLQDIEPFLEELEKFLSRPQLQVCNADQVCCLLQYPLELLVCCYACKIPADLEAESQLFLQRVKNVLESDDSAVNIGNAASLALDVTDMDAFFQYWADEMLLKYDYLDRERCVDVLEIIKTSLLQCSNN
ncbi:hypothetical protein PC129_g2512 [Phytophthora cactorum]|uniref:Uncharacterized protein n=3 Tax=Phytophthora cactorum TaxID=29920 RepID=A0A329T0W0_9STRA|nr:hypothetical protein Pcac1_g10780 [Phytophthora cactorum]KAG2839162.1 hypothetical protein PC112_g4234 [Phytophthora cactorum]KAG2841178.1 hypothetical protein PC111_g3210 [Phytophthora cactorum]KAG2864972.1 hypothetical protein PC113_g4130 [Phytophthora cactorum]KAG2924153.1 hypothetical protein PC114_g4605 [Phytophthora cactorum]